MLDPKHPTGAKEQGTAAAPERRRFWRVLSSIPHARSRWLAQGFTLPSPDGGKTEPMRVSLNDPVSVAFNTAKVWVKRKRDARFAHASAAVSRILDGIGSVNSETAQRKVLVIVAHPDDEAIGAGAVLRGMKDVTIVHVTQGAPGDDAYAQARGFPSRDAYAETRRKEVVAALGVIGIPPERIRGLGVIDGEAAWHLVDLCHRVTELMRELRPDVVLTHPYEGGHSDHDSTAFAVHLAAGRLHREGFPVPIMLELTSYHNYMGGRRFSAFLQNWAKPVKTIRLSPEDRRIKREMYDLFTSQRALLQRFPIEVERFREAPRYLFTVPPHEGELDYERLCRRVTGEQWRAEAVKALQQLRQPENGSRGPTR